MSTAASPLPHEAIGYAINHVFLPPCLPSSDDCDRKLDSTLVQTVRDSLLAFKEQVGDDLRGNVDSALAMITNLEHVHLSFGSRGSVSEEGLRDALNGLHDNDGKHISQILQARFPLINPGKVELFPFIYVHRMRAS